MIIFLKPFVVTPSSEPACWDGQIRAHNRFLSRIYEFPNYRLLSPNTPSYPQILGVSNFSVLGHPDLKVLKKTLFAINAI